MAKAKKNKKTSADSVYAKKANAAAKENPFASATPATSKKLNPFEVHVNKEKFQILGRTCKHDKGLPGVSRAKAVKRRKETLGQEFREKHKTNQFRDRRIGKHLSGADLTEDVMNARFMAEKMSQMKQSSSANAAARFNLNDDEVLTHRGQTLEEIEQFHDNRSDDEDDDDERLDADFTEAAHFGGDADQAKDRKTAIDEMIVEQKRRKIEIAKEKDEVHDLTEKLDSNYKTLMSFVGKMTKSEQRAKPAPDDYDKALREMVFEPRGVVADKLLSEEEVAKQEKERLERLEAERLKRMLGDGEEVEDAKAQPKHRSADDLDDGYFAYGEAEEEEGTLTYNMDGELGTKLTSNQEANAEEVVSEKEEELSGDEEDSDTDPEDDEEAEEERSDESGDDNESDADNLSDLKVTDSESDSDDANDVSNKKTSKKLTKEKLSNSKASKKAIERTDLPFTIEMPTSYADFTALLVKRTPEDLAIIVERLIKCNHPKLDGVNREKIVKLFAFLLQYINELFADASQDDIAMNFKILDRLNPHLYDLLHLNPERMSNTLLNVIKEKYTEYRKNPKVVPNLETIIFFKLVSNYYSTSDFRHPIVTPCYIFIQHILSKARVRTRQDIAIGLFLVTVVLEYAQHSKRFLPAALNFLLGVVYLSIPKRPVEVLRIVPPFQSTGPMNKLLAIPDNVEYSNPAEEQLLTSEDLVTITFTTDFKVRALNMSLKLIKDTIEIVGENVGSNYLAEPLLEIMERLTLDSYPTYVRDNYAAAQSALQSIAEKPLVKIVPPEKKPKALRLLEPRIETVYDDKRRPKLSKEKEEKAKLMAKVKRETKGAVREIRRDTEFLQKIRIQQQIRSDLERQEKVKRIYQEASVQQGELNEMARAKKKKKF